MKLTITRRLSATVLAATTATALAACGGDDSENTSAPAADTVTQTTTAASGTPVDDMSLLSTGESLTSTGIGGDDAAEFTFALDNLRDDNGLNCVDGVFEIVTPVGAGDDWDAAEGIDDGTFFEQNLGLSGGGLFDNTPVRPVSDGMVSGESLDTTLDSLPRDSDQDMSQTTELCFDPGDADAVVIEASLGVGDDLDPADVDGWRIDL